MPRQSDDPANTARIQEADAPTGGARPRIAPPKTEITGCSQPGSMERNCDDHAKHPDVSEQLGVKRGSGLAVRAKTCASSAICDKLISSETSRILPRECSETRAFIPINATRAMTHGIIERLQVLGSDTVTDRCRNGVWPQRTNFRRDHRRRRRIVKR